MKSKRTPELTAKIGEALDMGLSYKHAAQYAGISESTFWDWMNKSSEFSESIRAHEGKAAVWLMTLVNHAAQDDWHAAAWILEHRWPDDYARNRIEVAHTGGLDVTILAGIRAAVEHAFPDNPDAAALIADAIAQIEAAPPAAKKKGGKA